MDGGSHRCDLWGEGQSRILVELGACNEGLHGGSRTLANDGFDTVVLVVCVAMSDTNVNKGCRARNRPFAEPN